MGLAERLGQADLVQIRLHMGVSPGQRLQNMLTMQDVVLRNWRRRIRESHPGWSDLEICLAVFERLKQNG